MSDRAAFANSAAVHGGKPCKIGFLTAGSIFYHVRLVIAR